MKAEKTEKWFNDIVKTERMIRKNSDTSFSLRGMAEQLGISSTRLSEIEAGKTVPREDEFLKFSEIFRFDEEKQREFRSAYEELRDNPAVREAIQKAREEDRSNEVPLFVDFRDGSGTCLAGLDAKVINGRKNATFRKLTYTERTWPELPESLTITPQNKMVVMDVDGKELSCECSSADWFKLEIYLTACNFGSWQKEYFEPVLDGTTWSLEIEDENGNIGKSSGCNGYPAEWEKFLELKQYCCDLVC